MDSLYQKAEKLHLRQEYKEHFLPLVRRGTSLAMTGKNDSMLSKFYRLEAFYYLHKQYINNDSAKKYADLCVKYAQLSENMPTLSDGLAITATYYYLAERNYDSTIGFLKRQIQVLEAIKPADSISLLVVDHALAGMYEETEKLDSAWKYYNIVLDGVLSIKKTASDTAAKKMHRLQYLHIMALHDIAYLLVKQKTYTKALSYFMELDSLLPEKRKAFYPSIYTGKAACYEKLNQIDSAMKYYKLGIDNFKNDHFSTTPNPAPYLEYAKLLAGQGQARKAEGYLQTASGIVWGQSIREERYILATELALGNYYIAQKQWAPAADTLQAALALAKKLQNTEQQSVIYQNLSLLNENQGNYKAALDYSTLSRQFYDSLQTQHFARQTSEMDAKYQADKKNQRIALLQKNNRIQQLQLLAAGRLRLFYVLGVVVLIALFGVFYYYRRALQQRKLERIKNELETKALRAQMKPHFIFNCLNAIQELIITKDYSRSSQYLAEFSRLLRMVLNMADKNFIPLQQEVELCRLYISLESLRLKHNFHYSITVDEKMDTEMILFPTLLVQPFVENAIWHGLSNKKGEKQLFVHFEEVDDRVRCTITDNGIGRERSAAIKAAKIGTGHFDSKGTLITEQRVSILREGLVKEASIKIEDLYDDQGSAAGTKVVIDIVPF
ncbi:Histidine kinase [Niabella drilacis]|uniref:Histidine kinase n=2 Tax=Niabella drilacis (strain DSM 25811 / CCM 8410 / CCUG 62505 / LMG 26954 / E90) TaxID=1285928 RepID=A0A1G6WJ00_NIADE|nr:Histidine kinase [Niabella drilacis]